MSFTAPQPPGSSAPGAEPSDRKLPASQLLSSSLWNRDAPQAINPALAATGSLNPMLHYRLASSLQKSQTYTERESTPSPQVGTSAAPEEREPSEDSSLQSSSRQPTPEVVKAGSVDPAPEMPRALPPQKLPSPESVRGKLVPVPVVETPRSSAPVETPRSTPPVETPRGTRPGVERTTSPVPLTDTPDRQRLCAPSNSSHQEDWWDHLVPNPLNWFEEVDCCTSWRVDHSRMISKSPACGVGIELKEIGYGELAISNIQQHSPAATCGRIAIGDEIVEVDGKYLYRARGEVVKSALLGPEGTEVTLTLRRKGNEELDSNNFKVRLRRQHTRTFATGSGTAFQRHPTKMTV